MGIVTMLTRIWLSDFGHDKSIDIKPYAQLPDSIRPTLLYAGDGISDLCAAAETDLLFARAGKGMSFSPVIFPCNLRPRNMERM